MWFGSPIQALNASKRKGGKLSQFWNRMLYEIQTWLRLGLLFWCVTAIVVFVWLYPRFLIWIVGAEFVCLLTLIIGKTFVDLQNDFQNWLSDRRGGNKLLATPEVSDAQKSMVFKSNTNAGKLQELEQRYGISTVVMMKFLIDKRYPPIVSNLDYITWVGLIHKVIRQIDLEGVDRAENP